MLDLQREIRSFPKGRPLTPPGAKPVKLGNFEVANELEQEWRRLYREGEREVMLEEGPDGPTLAAWRKVRESYWDWSRELLTGADAARLGTLENTLNANARAFGARCREALRRLG